MKHRRSSTLASLTAFLLSATTLATPAITGVTARQHYPWDGMIDISYTISGDIGASVPDDVVAVLKVSATDQNTGLSYTATSLSGDLSLVEGTHNIAWNMDEQGLLLLSTNVVFTVSCEAAFKTFCVIDLSAGDSASAYPATYLDEPPSGGFTADEYKSTKLVLKRIEPGTFIMGEDQANENRRVTLTQPFFLGLFEMTQKQYQLVTGNNPSSFSGDMRPVETVSYDAIRGSSNGSRWPSTNAVDSSSLLGKLRARTGLDFDLPTEAQWEYACRAGTTTTYSYGNSADGNYMWCSGNSSQTHEVGTKNPNSWGLYDMHGNVAEWCLDWYGSLVGGTDPKGSFSVSDYRVRRGGAWNSNAAYCILSVRAYSTQSYESYDIGFRLARTLTE